MSRHDPDLGPTMPNIELVRNIFIYFNVFEFHVLRSIFWFKLSCKNTQQNIHTDAHKDSEENFTVASYKSSTIMMYQFELS